MEPNISTEYLGVKLKSPIIIAPAGITETAERITRCEENGAGAVVMKTLGELDIMRFSPTPRFRLLKKGKGLNQFVLYSIEQASQFTPEEYAAEISRSRRLVNIPIIASITCGTEKMWVERAKLVEDAGAAALEINMACPHGIFASYGSGIEGYIAHITELVTSAIEIPVVPKLPSQLTEPMMVAKQVQEAGAKGVVIFNRFTGLDIDIDKQAPILHGGFAGHGGYHSIHYPLRWITEISPSLEIDISASGGVSRGRDAVKYLLAGATVVQVCTVVILNGYEVIKKINSEIADYMSKHNFTSISQFRGLVCDRILKLEEYDRRLSVRAVIDKEKCTGCGSCFKACFYKTIIPDGKIYQTTSECAGCGLCHELCEFEAITMVPFNNNHSS